MIHLCSTVGLQHYHYGKRYLNEIQPEEESAQRNAMRKSLGKQASLLTSERAK